MAENNKDRKKRVSTAAKVGVGTTAVAAGAMSVDLRPNLAKGNHKYLGSTLGDVQQHIQPGDIFVGANTTPHESLKSNVKEVVDYYKHKTKDAPKGLRGIKQKLLAAKQSFGQIEGGAIGSKFSHPTHSHAEVFTGYGETIWGGGGVTSPSIPRSKHSKSSKALHGYILRSKNQKANVINSMALGSGSIDNIYQRIGNILRSKKQKEKRMGKIVGENYTTTGAAKASLLDAVTPKLRSKEKSVVYGALKKGEEAFCSSGSARCVKHTVGGKVAKRVLPHDFLRSDKFEVVGTVGKGKISKMERMLFSAPKAAVRLGTAGAIGVVAYGTAKAVGAIKNRSQGIEKTSSRILGQHFAEICYYNKWGMV